MDTTEAREQAFILLFEKSFNEDTDCEKIMQLALESEVIKESKYTTDLFTNTCENCETIDSYIEKYAKGWSISRISKVSLALLRLAICEMMYMDKTPGIAISEAVRLCKKYSTDDEYTFINGILGSFAKDYTK